MPELWDVYDKNYVKTGRLHERGTPLCNGEYHLIVHIWIVNSRNEWLITKRAPGISWSGYWQATGGSATAGDTSLSAVLREAQEEIGIALDPDAGSLFTHYREEKTEPGGHFVDVWLFHRDIDLSDIVLQPEETCDALWADAETIQQMRENGTFLPPRMNPYADALFASLN